MTGVNGAAAGAPAQQVIPTVGMLEWFRPGEEARVERVLKQLRRLDVKHLRTGVSWADWYTAEGEQWYSWLLPRLGAEVELLPCFVYTPPSLGVEPKSSAPPREPKRYADFIDHMITRFGDFFTTLELWNEPNNMSEWDWTLDAHWYRFGEMVGGAAYWAKQRGKQTVLGGMSPFDPAWLDLIFQRGVMQYIDVVGIHGFPDVWERQWHGWPTQIAMVQQVLDQHGSDARIWITEAGFSTWQHDEYAQLRSFVKALRAPVDRLYWYAMEDLNPTLSTIDGFHRDEREYHFGVTRHDGAPKLLYRLWEDGGLRNLMREEQQAVLEDQQRRQVAHARDQRYVLITGGAGFVGTNLAHRILSEGQRVLVYDNLSRPGVEQNLRWLRAQHGDRLLVEVADVRNPYKLNPAVAQASAVFHLAAQVAVTTSLLDPEHDFEVNARGTFNLLEALRRNNAEAPLVFTSTNKVYGNLEGVAVEERPTRYAPRDHKIDAEGIDESQPVDFHSPYGASKGAADHYVLDYARTFGLPATLFRMSCIYGPHQFGTEDQGWVAHFLLHALNREPITIYGDGKQVRDILYVTDLVEAFLRAQRSIERMAGRAFNVGGGAQNSTSLLELLDLIADLHGAAPVLRFAETRTGDQRYYVSDTSRLLEVVGWQPQVAWREGVAQLYRWLKQHRSSQAPVLPAESLHWAAAAKAASPVRVAVKKITGVRIAAS